MRSCDTHASVRLLTHRSRFQRMHHFSVLHNCPSVFVYEIEKWTSVLLCSLLKGIVDSTRQKWAALLQASVASVTGNPRALRDLVPGGEVDQGNRTMRALHQIPLSLGFLDYLVQGTNSGSQQGPLAVRIFSRAPAPFVRKRPVIRHPWIVNTLAMTVMARWGMDTRHGQSAGAIYSEKLS